MGLDDIFKFGKHEGEQLEDVIDDDRDYIEWLVMMNIVEFDNEALELISRKGIA